MEEEIKLPMRSEKSPKKAEEEYVYQILLDQKSRYIDRLYSYSYSEKLDIGTMVEVPFGKGNKLYEGVVVSEESGSEQVELKRILRILEKPSSLNAKRLCLANWIKEQYLSSHRDAIALFYPQSIREISVKNRRCIRLTDRASLSEAFRCLPGNATRKKAVYEEILKETEIYEDDLKRRLGVAVGKYIQDLESRQMISINLEKSYRRPKIAGMEPSKELFLTEEQKQVYDEILQEMRGDNRPILLRGITGSGKTQIYIQLMKQIKAQGKGIIVLVPEIALTPQTINRFEEEAGEELAIIHSNLSKSEKADEWRRIEEMQAPVVIGARSAIFAPVADLGLLIIDECHDEAYKSEQSPKYDAVALAEEMNRVLGCAVVLGSATPKLTQYHRSCKQVWKLTELTKRVHDRPLPKVEIVNMIDDAKDGNTSFLSRRLQYCMEEELSKGNQIILYINRRGYAGFVTCRECGHIPKCAHCDISLTYHKEKNVLRCHYCNYEEAFQRRCSSCSDGFLEDRGMGTERIVQEVEQIFPKASIYRMDRDTVKKRGDHEKILGAFRKSSAGVLVGTQMIGKGHDFPKVNLVGIIDADQGMYFPDYRSNERTFSSIEQVGGRAGRLSGDGRVIIQTFSVRHPLFSYIENHDYEGFYSEEIQLRKAYVYPPYGNLIRILVSGFDEKKVASSAMKIKEAFVFYVTKKKLSTREVYGPYPCMISKIENRHRWQILLKDKDIPLEQIRKMLSYILGEKRNIVLEKEVYAVVDINPSNMI